MNSLSNNKTMKATTAAISADRRLGLIELVAVLLLNRFRSCSQRLSLLSLPICFLVTLRLSFTCLSVQTSRAFKYK